MAWEVQWWVDGQAFLEEVMEEGWVLDGTIAQDSTQTAGIWGLREGISVALKHAGTILLFPHFLQCHPHQMPLLAPFMFSLG